MIDGISQMVKFVMGKLEVEVELEHLALLGKKILDIICCNSVQQLQHD